MVKSNNQRGMTLLEIMISVAILGIISVGVMKLMENMNKTSRTASKAGDIESVTREIQNILNVKESCSVTVFGALGNGNTILTGIKQIDPANGYVTSHPRLIVSTPSSPKYVAPGMIINGMLLKFISNFSGGANYELVITFIKSVRATTSTVAANMTLGQNIVTKTIPLQLDNCNRFVAAGNTLDEAAGQCAANTNGFSTTVGSAVSIYSDAPAAVNAIGISDTTVFVACKECTATRTTVNGCL